WPGLGQGVVEHPEMSGIALTVSNEVGRRVGQRAVARGAKYLLEMGGKNPVIVLEDADLDRAVEATVSGGLRTSGQKCTATSRVFVQGAVYDPFKEKLLSRVKEIQVGDGMDRRTWMGPLVSEEQLQRV